MISSLLLRYISISTHDLTRRSTVEKQPGSSLILFQLTTSRGGRHCNCAMSALESHFNSRPHEEVDAAVLDRQDFSTKFQLTTSRGGRPLLLSRLIMTVKFQLTTSRGGRHTASASAMVNAYISTHDLTRRSTSTYIRS